MFPHNAWGGNSVSRYLLFNRQFRQLRIAVKSRRLNIDRAWVPLDYHGVFRLAADSTRQPCVSFDVYDSVALEWRCATNAHADQNVSNRQSDATPFNIGRIKPLPHKYVILNLHRSTRPATARVYQGSSTVVI